MKTNIPQAAVLNAACKIVKGSKESISEACRAAEERGWNNFSGSLANASGADSFPITSFTWIYLRTPPTGSVPAASLGDFLDWIYSDGQQSAVSPGYSALPPPPQLLAALRKKAKAAVQ